MKRMSTRTTTSLSWRPNLTLRALTDAISRGTDERVILVFNARSPVRAMLRFGRVGARARRDRLAAELLVHFERLRRRVAALMLIWQTSHVGELLNEWADVMCEKFCIDDDYPIEFASLTFPQHKGTAQEYVMCGMSRIVADRPRHRVKETVLRNTDEHVQLLGVTPETLQICDEIASRRCQYVDQPYADIRVKRILSVEWCPFGCLEHAGGWREIHPSAMRRAIHLPQFADSVATRLPARQGAVVLFSAQEELEGGGSGILAGDAVCS